MIYGTDLCDSACKHCLIWTKRPVNYLPFEKIKEIMQSRCVTKKTTVGLEGGEFMLHPDAMDIMAWFNKHHPNFDRADQCPETRIGYRSSETKSAAKTVYFVDGDRDSYLHMRGKDGYDGIINVLERTHKKVPISLMFTLSPYNDFGDMQHVAKVANDTILICGSGYIMTLSFLTPSRMPTHDIGSLKSEEIRSFSEARN